jgi:hypothetical protein
MASWSEFVEEAPRIADIFVRRHTATNNLCLLATIRSDESPRISPMEPGILEDHLVLVGMPRTTKHWERFANSSCKTLGSICEGRCSIPSK